jgi:hypothetical protein
MVDIDLSDLLQVCFLFALFGEDALTVVVAPSVQQLPLLGNVGENK